MAKTLKKSKKTGRVVEDVVIHINATYNNTHITVSDLEGNVLTWSTGGKVGYKGARESTPYVAGLIAAEVIEEAQRLHGIKNAKLFVKGIGAGRDQAIRGVVNTGVNIDEVQDITPIPYNGCKKKKVRKL